MLPVNPCGCDCNQDWRGAAGAWVKVAGVVFGAWLVVAGVVAVVVVMW